MQKIYFLLLFAVIGARLLQAQGTFQNLDFESAQLIYVDPPLNDGIATTNALPGWSAFSGTNSLPAVRYGPGGGSFPVELDSQTNGGSIDGHYSVSLAWNSGPSQPSNTFGSISQTGLVPANAQSLLFELTPGSNGAPIAVSLGGQDLSYLAISNALNYTLYGAAIPSSFTGQTEALAFTVGFGGTGYAKLDDIQFSTIQVPEPSGISFLCLGSGILLYVRHRKRFWL